MELFTARVCPYAHRTQLALLEKGLRFEHTEVDFKNKTERFLSVSPYGKVPALFHDGQTIYESVIINEYLDEVFPDPPLMLEGPALRAKARIWNHYCNEYLMPDLYAVLRNRDRAKHSELAAKVAGRLQFVEREAFGVLSGKGPYWFGDQVSLTDLAWYPYFERLPAWTHWRGISIPEDCPRLIAWAKAMSGRQSVQSVANGADYYIERFRDRAGEQIAA